MNISLICACCLYRFDLGKRHTAFFLFSSYLTIILYCLMRFEIISNLYFFQKKTKTQKLYLAKTLKLHCIILILASFVCYLVTAATQCNTSSSTYTVNCFVMALGCTTTVDAKDLKGSNLPIITATDKHSTKIVRNSPLYCNFQTRRYRIER